MSHDVEEHYTVYEESTRKARKEHECDACDDKIRVGDKYVHVFIVFQGDHETIKRCARCQAIHMHLRQECQGQGMWPAERLDCGEEYEEHWGKAPPDEIAALAFMTADEMQAKL